MKTFLGMVIGVWLLSATMHEAAAAQGCNVSIAPGSACASAGTITGCTTDSNPNNYCTDGTQRQSMLQCDNGGKALYYCTGATHEVPEMPAYLVLPFLAAAGAIAWTVRKRYRIGANAS